MDNSSEQIVKDNKETVAKTSTEKSNFGFKKMLLSESFSEKATLLFLTALISGLLIPFIGNNIQARKSQNEIVLQAQSKLFDDITNTILTYETLALDVSWYKSNKKVENEAMHKLAFERYSARVVDLFAQWRAQIIKAQNLVSPQVSKKLKDFHLKVLHDQDTPITSLYGKGNTNEWTAMHQVSENTLIEGNKLISDLAIDLKITKSNIQ